MSKTIAIGPDVTNGAQATIEAGAPYVAAVQIVGVADLLFHRWNVEAVAAKGRAPKGSAAKKTDDLESYVYRTPEGELAVPGEYLRGSIVNAAKYRQDPRSPRKSAMDLFKAGVVALTPLAGFGVSAWDYEHRCRVTVQRNGVTRCRPALRVGWTLEVELLVNLSEYIPPDVLHEVIGNAGRLIGLADFRPTYGRYAVKRFEVLAE